MNNIKKIKCDKAEMIFQLIIYLLSSIIIISVLFPLIFILSASFSEPNLVNTGKVFLFPRGFNLDGYRRLLEYKTIWTGYGNTILYTVVGTAINVILTIMAAYPLSRKDFYGRRVLTFIITFTMFFNGGLIPTYILIKNLNILNSIWAMVLPGAVSVWNLIITRTFFMNTLPEELNDAAKVDGCTNIKYLLQIVLPLSKSIIAVISLYYAVGHWNQYFSALIYLSEEKKYPLQLVLRSIVVQLEVASEMVMDEDSFLDQQRIADMIRYGVIIIASLPMLILYPFLQKYFVQGVMVGSLKG